jgi:hypothetical protein
MILLFALAAFADGLPAADLPPAWGPRAPLEVPGEPRLRRCLDVSPPPLPTNDVTGQLFVQVRVHKGKVALVTTTTADPQRRALPPCFEREVVISENPVRRARREVPIVPADTVAATPEKPR